MATIETITPYTDEVMEWNDDLGMYILREQALINRGIDLRARLNKLNAVSPESIINNILLTTSEMIYGFIHEHSVDNTQQDILIATIKQLRPIIQRALEQQCTYYLEKGNLQRAVDPSVRAIAIDELAKNTLNKTIDGLGCPITYIGRL